ncbi:uncharacterized protein STEHIDRAFT_153041 [Stereum hirsutum FP-91666 SS1]|uniref:uncharacterized protein n=1 Tax=Stereum hirsutum (strain FP-91666) TaxID=721885 RepID=UPI000440AA28|nr:uncharacterized protein STEHIDRAFT_153041 [Stereum hirsutum FP-91666 SS1]EIM91395.1 hypothetical protein STEHIDRAFT_153041 [Stereum hirsutum FP-91666 SS1]
MLATALASSGLTPAIEQDLSQILVNKYFFLAALTVVIWDYLCTLPDEIQTIWKRNKRLPTYIFLLLRYYALSAMIVVAYGKWSIASHLHVEIKHPGYNEVVPFRLFFYENDWRKLCEMELLPPFGMQTVIGFWIWTFPGSGPAPDPIDNTEFHICIFLPPKRAGSLSPIYVLFELGFETLIFVLTMARTFYLYKMYPVVGSRRSTLTQCLIRDGALYYFAIFSFNLLWAVMILHAPTGLRAIAAVPTAAFSATLISRITFNIRIEVMGPTNVFERTENGIPLANMQSDRKPTTPRVLSKYESSRSTEWFQPA